jgi:hypothetical protein
MRSLRIATVFLIILGLATSTAWAADPPKIAHDKITCVPADGNVRIAVNVTSSSPITLVRVYFHSVVKTSGDYYLELRQGQAGGYWAVLPYPLAETTAVLYRIVVKDADGVETATETFTVPTSSSCVVTLTGDETKYANNLIIGLTSDSQPAIPDGFKCKGVVSKITVAGDLKPNDECRQALLVAGGAISPAVWIAGGIAAGAGAGAIVANNAGCNCPPVSSALPPAASVTVKK